MSAEFCRVLGASGRNLVPNGAVGINTLPDQLVSKKTKSGFNFNVMVVGDAGIGKSTLMETLFKVKMPESDPKDNSSQLEVVEHSIEEDNVTLNLKIVSVQNYGRAIDMTNCINEATAYIDKQFDEYLDMEWSVPRRHMTDPDPRIHVCIYLLSPTGRTVRSFDLVAMKELAGKCNLVPVIAKADTIIQNNIEGFKDRITDDLCDYGVLYYEFPMEDEALKEKNENFQNELPFAVCGSKMFVDVGGKKVRGREYPWGVVEVENAMHSQFPMLRDSIVRSNMDHLIKSTHDLHYEEYRREQMATIGYSDNDYDQEPTPLAENAQKQLSVLESEMSGRSKKSAECLMKRVNQKISEVKKREDAIDANFKPRINEANQVLKDLEAEKREVVEALKEIAQQEANEAAHARKTKKKSGVFRKI